jgi:elongation factor 2
MDEGTVNEKAKGKELIEQLLKAGLPRDEAKSVMCIQEDNIFIDATKGVQYLQDIKELLLQGFKEAVTHGPMAKEEVTGVKVILTDASIHVDPAHRGPAQLLPAIKRPIYAGILQARPSLLEPKQKLVILTPSDYLSSVITLINGRRGQVLEISQEGETANITGKVPVAEMFGFSNDIRSATQGRASWYFEYAGYERLPTDLQTKIISAIRKRKGEPEMAPTAKDFMD